MLYLSVACSLQQYLYIVDTCVLNTGLGLAGIFVLSMVLIRNIWASLQIVVVICMILGDLLGVMAMWNITLNGRNRRRTRKGEGVKEERVTSRRQRAQLSAHCHCFLLCLSVSLFSFQLCLFSTL